MTLKKSIGERIQLYRSVNDLTQQDLAKIADCSKQLVSAWEGGRAEITVSSVVLLARRLGIDPRWLLLGDRDTERHTLKTPNLIQHIPLVTKAQIIEHTLSRHKGPPSSLQTISTVAAHPGSCFAMPCLDDGMAPSYRRGDLLIVDPNLQPSPDTHVVATVFKDGTQDMDEPHVVVRRVHFDGGVGTPSEPYRLVPSAPGWPEISVTSRSTAVLVGRVVATQTRLIELCLVRW